MLVSSGFVELGSDEGTFVIRSTGGELIAEEWSGNTLVTLDQDTLATGDVIVQTGDQWGPFGVTTQLLTQAPDDDSAWEDVVEFSLTCPEGVVVAELVNHDPTADLLPAPGAYRIRVNARGRAFDAALDEGDEGFDHSAPVEHYLVQAWPAEAAAPAVVRLSSAYAEAELAGPQPDLVIQSAEAGLAGAAAIGRDVDDAPGARTLSSLTGTATAAHVLQGTRRKLFMPFAYVLSWSPGPTGWMYIGGNLDYKLGAPGYGFAHDHPDQLSGSRGAIRSIFVEVERPRRVVRHWNWMVTPLGSDLGLSSMAPFLLDDTVLTITFTETKNGDGQPWTEIQIEHTGLPVEWVDDMRAWWQFQLAIADSRGFGTR